MFEKQKDMYYPFVASKIFVRERCMKRELKNKDIEGVVDALIKKAVGYNTDEIVEEYVIDEQNKEHLVKKKVTKKFIPADLTASKMLLDYYGTKTSTYENMSDNELDQEAIKLFKEYQNLSEIDLCEIIKGEQN